MPPRRSYPKTTGPMDHWLESQGYYRKHTARDGSCLFRAISEQVFYTQAVHLDVRRQCFEFIQRNKQIFKKLLEESVDDYVARMQSSREWGGQIEINAMSLLYRRDVLVFEEVGTPPSAATNYGFSKKLLLCFSPDNHYDSVYPKLYIVKAGFCQSLVYEVLYKNVFKLPDVNYAVNKMLHDKTNRIQKERTINDEHLLSCGRFGFAMEISLDTNREEKDEEMYKNVKELLAQGLTPFPYKVAKALDPNIYRNIEFDIWNDFRRELKFGWYRNNGELQVGVKCLVKLNPDRSFHAHIQEMSPDKGPVIVFVEELGEKCTVPYDNLEPLPKSEKPQWPLPYKHCRQLSSIQQKSALLALTEFGNKWKKSKVGKSRKIKENNVHSPISPRLQYNNKMNTGPMKYSAQHNDRFLHEQIGNQQVQMAFQNFSSENFSNMQNYNNVGMDIPTIPVSLMLEQTNSSSNPVMTQAMLMSLTPPVTETSNHPNNATAQSREHGSSAPEKCMSPLQQPDSTTDVPCADHPMISEPQSSMEQPVCNSSSLSPTQFLSFATYTSAPPLGPQLYVPTSGPRPDSSTSNLGFMNSSTCLSDTVCTKTTAPPYMVCNTGANMGVIGIPGGNSQPPKDCNGNILFQPVNFMAQKSLQVSGNDLPLSDIPTLRFYYNLGHDYFRLSCMYWPPPVLQTKPNLVQPMTTMSGYGENANYGNPVTTSNIISTNENQLPDSTTTLQENMYQLGQDVAQNLMLSNNHSAHMSPETDKRVCFHTNNGDNENLTWQPKPVETDVPRVLQKAFNPEVISGINNSENRLSNAHMGRPQQNANEQYGVHSVAQESENIEGSSRHTTDEARSSTQSNFHNVLGNNYNISPPAVPLAFAPISPTVFNPTVVPFYFPMDSEQGMMPVPYYPQYTVSFPVPLASQDAPDASTGLSEVQASSSQFTGSVYSSAPQNNNVESGCIPPYTVHPQPPIPFVYQQPSPVQPGIYPTGTGPIANVSVPRWVQSASNPPHVASAPCVFQAPPVAVSTGTPVTFNPHA